MDEEEQQPKKSHLENEFPNKITTPSQDLITKKMKFLWILFEKARFNNNQRDTFRIMDKHHLNYLTHYLILWSLSTNDWKKKTNKLDQKI